MDKIYTFSPSEFAFNYAGCKRCYYDQTEQLLDNPYCPVHPHPSNAEDSRV